MRQAEQQINSANRGEAIRKRIKTTEPVTPSQKKQTKTADQNPTPNKGNCQSCHIASQASALTAIARGRRRRRRRKTTFGCVCVNEWVCPSCESERSVGNNPEAQALSHVHTHTQTVSTHHCALSPLLPLHTHNLTPVLLLLFLFWPTNSFSLSSMASLSRGYFIEAEFLSR